MRAGDGARQPSLLSCIVRHACGAAGARPPPCGNLSRLGPPPHQCQSRRGGGRPRTPWRPPAGQRASARPSSPPCGQAGTMGYEPESRSVRRAPLHRRTSRREQVGSAPGRRGGRSPDCESQDENAAGCAGGGRGRKRRACPLSGVECAARRRCGGLLRGGPPLFAPAVIILRPQASWRPSPSLPPLAPAPRRARAGRRTGSAVRRARQSSAPPDPCIPPVGGSGPALSVLARRLRQPAGRSLLPYPRRGGGEGPDARRSAGGGRAPAARPGHR